MRYGLVVLMSFLVLATPVLAGRPEFIADKATPLRLIPPRAKPALVAKFSGTVQISGRFQFEWRTREYLQATFYPDGASAALLPYEPGRGPVKVLLLIAAERAAAMLLDAPTARALLARETASTSGEATVTIRDYETGVACDQRYYAAELQSVSARRDHVAAIADQRSVGC
jgi:hypothetical protein